MSTIPFPEVKLGLLIVAFFWCALAGPTQDFLKEGHERPILLYECYRTGVALPPADKVNFTFLWDGTQATNNKGTVKTWIAGNNTPDSYTTGNLKFKYNKPSKSLRIQQQSLKEHDYELIKPFNGLAYYFEIVVISDNDLTLYKIYDTDSSCGNAAVVRYREDPQNQKGFVFTRDVREPTVNCSITSMCPS
ncbi:uncharacterized protein LOC144141815 [Haemaphysalis longicornis]